MADLPRGQMVLILPPRLAHLESEAKRQFPGVTVKIGEPIPVGIDAGLTKETHNAE